MRRYCVAESCCTEHWASATCNRAGVLLFLVLCASWCASSLHHGLMQRTGRVGLQPDSRHAMILLTPTRNVMLIPSLHAVRLIALLLGFSCRASARCLIVRCSYRAATPSRAPARVDGSACARYDSAASLLAVRAEACCMVAECCAHADVRFLIGSWFAIDCGQAAPATCSLRTCCRYMLGFF